MMKCSGRRPGIIFPPDLCPIFHVANAVILWWGYKTARQRGCDFIVRKDDLAAFADNYGFTKEKREQADVEIDTALDLLGIVPNQVMYRSWYRPMYDRALHLFSQSKQAHEWETAKQGLKFRDLARGEYAMDDGMVEIMTPASFLKVTGWIQVFRNACDYIAYRTPIHIRGAEIASHSCLETLMMKQVLAWLGPFANGYNGPDYVHIPWIRAEKNGMLNKTHNVPPEYAFTRWAEQFSSVEERRLTLERMVTRPGARDVTVEDILPIAKIAINSKGERICEHTLQGEFDQAIELAFAEVRHHASFDGEALADSAPHVDAETRLWAHISQEMEAA